MIKGGRLSGSIAVLIILLSPLILAETRFIDENNRDYVESRIKVLSEYDTNDTYFLNYSQDGYEYRANPQQYVGTRAVKGIGLYVIELDAHVSQKITFLDYYTLQVKIEENPNNPYPSNRVPLRLCMNNNSVRNANRFETPVPYCEHDKQYYIGNIQIGAEYTIRLNEDLRNTTSLIWWLGEDDLDGTYGQGGGLPICSAVSVSLTLNTTQAYLYVDNIKAQFSAIYTPYQAGCTITFERLQTKNNVGLWRKIPKAVDENPAIPFICRAGQDCEVNPASWGTTYTRLISCTTEGNQSVRNRYTGTKSGNPYTAYSPTRIVECLATGSPSNFVQVIKDTDNQKRYIYVIPLVLILASLSTWVLGREKK